MLEQFSLTGKHILIAGASGRIGSALARSAAELGAQCTLVGRRQEALENILATLTPAEHSIHAVDLTVAEQRQALSEKLKPLNGMIYAAASVPKLIPFHMQTSEAMEATFVSIVFSPLEFSRVLLRDKKISNAASLVFISSVGAASGLQASTYYAAAHSALIGGVRGLGMEVVKRRIRCNLVSFGYVGDTLVQLGGQTTPLNIPLGIPEAENIVGAPMFLLSDASRWITRKNICVDGGSTLCEDKTLF